MHLLVKRWIAIRLTAASKNVNYTTVISYLENVHTTLFFLSTLFIIQLENFKVVEHVTT